MCRGNLLASSRECYFESTGSVMDIKITCVHVGGWRRLQRSWVPTGHAECGVWWGHSGGDTRCILSSAKGSEMLTVNIRPQKDKAPVAVSEEEQDFCEDREYKTRARSGPGLDWAQYFTSAEESERTPETEEWPKP